MSDWSSLKLVTELQQKNQSLHAKLTTVVDYVEPLLRFTRPIGSEEFTDHDFAHSTRIAHRIAQFLPSSCVLNGTELYLLLLAVLLHDSGMWGPKEEVLQLPDDASFREWAERSHSLSWKQVQEDLAFQPRRWMGEMGLRHLAAIWFRINHPTRLGSFVFDPKSPTGSTLRVLMGENFIRHVATIAVAHSWDRARVLEDESLDPQEIGAEPVNLRFLASLLRLGDLLDLGEGRISTLLWDYLRPLNAVSEMHWRKEHTLRVRNCSADRIEVVGDFDIDSGGLTTSEAYRLALEWLDWLEAEIKDCARIVHTRVPDEYAPRCRLGKLEFDRTRVKANGLVTGEKIAFELNRRRILELLGDEIYSTDSVFVRELLQNALDATRAQIVRDHHREMQDDPVTYPPDRPWDWPHSVTGMKRYAIDVNVTEEKDSRGRDLVLFSVTDRGTGMTLKQIKNHFLQVGVSYYQSDQFKTEFRFKPISRFGIGFLSCLTVAQPEGRIEVLTRAAGEPAGLKLSIQLPSDQYLISKDQTLPQGTTVKVWIDPAADHPPGWDAPPIRNEQAAKAVQVSIPKNATALQNIELAVMHWLLLPEVRLCVNSVPHEPLGLAKASRGHAINHFNEPHHLSLRFEAPSGRLLGTGVLERRIYNSGLPMGKSGRGDIWGGVHCHRGIYLGHSDFWFGAHNSPSYLRWNSNYLPRHSLSAGRALRGKNSPLKSALEDWERQVYCYYHSELLKRSAEVASLFRWSITDANDEGLPLLTYPVSTHRKLEWLTIDQIKVRAPVLLVPFGIAYHEALPALLPLVGLPQFGFSDTDRCKLVHLGNCTAVLWPPEAPTKGLDVFDGGITFVGSNALGPAVGANRSPSLVLENLERFAPKTYSRSRLPDYDREFNPWEFYGLESMSGWGFEDSYEGNTADELLHSVDPIPFPEDLLRVVIPDGDEWE